MRRSFGSQGSWKIKAKELHLRFGIGTHNINRWHRTLQKGAIPQGNGWRPPIFTPEAKKFITKSLDIEGEEKFRMRPANYKVLLDSQAKVSAESRSIVPVDQIISPSRHTIRRLEAELNINEGSAETTTDARAESVRDVRNLVSFIVLNMAIKDLVTASLIMNADATQYPVGR